MPPRMSLKWLPNGSPEASREEARSGGRAFAPNGFPSRREHTFRNLYYRGTGSALSSERCKNCESSTRRLKKCKRRKSRKIAARTARGAKAGGAASKEQERPEQQENQDSMPVHSPVAPLARSARSLSGLEMDIASSFSRARR